jgi:hypothetical protein
MQVFIFIVKTDRTCILRVAIIVIMHAETLLGIAMMHSDSLIVRAKMGDQGAQGKLVQLWYKRIYNFGYKFFLDHDLAMEVA